MSIRCKISGHADLIVYEKTYPNGDEAIKAECERCGKVVYGAATVTVDTDQSK